MFAGVRDVSISVAPMWGVFMKNARVAVALVTEVLLMNRGADEESEFPLPADVLISLSLRRLPAAELLCQTAD